MSTVIEQVESTVIEQVEAFREFVLEQSQSEEAGVSLEDLFQRWCASRPMAQELEQSLRSLNRGLADVEAGRLVDADQSIHETRSRLQRSA